MPAKEAKPGPSSLVSSHFLHSYHRFFLPLAVKTSLFYFIFMKIDNAEDGSARSQTQLAASHLHAPKPVIVRPFGVGIIF